MIDCISGGRLIAGMVVGGGPEYYSFSLTPAHAWERFNEAHDLIIKAWTEPGTRRAVSRGAAQMGSVKPGRRTGLASATTSPGVMYCA